jgi:hypothetical protein
MNSEEWRKIPDFPAYSISNHGRVRRDVGGVGAVAGRILKFNLMTSGYRCVQLWRDSKPHPRSVHRLVASVFLPEAEDSHTEVAHYDGNRLNNHVLNLRWTDRRGNLADMKRHGTNPIGSRNAMAKLREADVVAIRRLREMGFSTALIADRFKVSRANIEFILRGKTWKHVA